MIDKIVLARLKKKVRDNPYIGIKESDGSYYYKEGSHTVRYQILNDQSRESPVKIISVKHKLSGLEKQRRNFRKSLGDFLFHYGWISIFRPQTLLFLISGIVILYLGVIDPYRNKIERFRWIAANVIGVRSEQLEYRGGMFRLFAKREVAGKQTEEQVSFTFSPLNLFSFRTTGYVTRWSQDSGYITNEVSFDGKGNVWLGLSNGTWIHGVIGDERVKWDKPKRSGPQEISGHKIVDSDGTVYIIDQQ